jgi:hypothetical protein
MISEAWFPYLNKFTIALAATVLYHACNVYNLLPGASDVHIDPLQSCVVGCLVFLACMLVEYSWKRQGYLAAFKTVPDLSSLKAGVQPAGSAFFDSSSY